MEHTTPNDFLLPHTSPDQLKGLLTYLYMIYSTRKMSPLLIINHLVRTYTQNMQTFFVGTLWTVDDFNTSPRIHCTYPSIIRRHGFQICIKLTPPFLCRLKLVDFEQLIWKGNKKCTAFACSKQYIVRKQKLGIYICLWIFHLFGLGRNLKAKS